MSTKVEKIEKNVATVNLEISPEDFDKAVNDAYHKNKGKFSIPGFRKGKAPRKIIENNYGAGIFYEEALDIAFPSAYTKAIEELELKPVARPVMVSLNKISSAEGVEMVIDVAVEPEFEVKNYKGIEVQKLDYEVTDEKLEAELKIVQDKNSRLVSVDEPAKDGDTAIIDFEGFVGDVAFDGGKGENYPLVLGSGSFIPGFEEQLIGKKAGEETDVNVTFPEEYHASELAGKEAVFKVKVHEVKAKEMPELDDEFAKDVSEFDTLDEYKNDLKKQIKVREEQTLRNLAVQTIIDKLVAETEIDLPQAMIDEKAQEVKEQFEQQISANGMDPKVYYEIVKAQNEENNDNKFEDMFKDQAVTDLKQELIINKIIEQESIEATEEELEKEYETFAKAYNQKVEDFKKTADEYTKDYISNFIKQRKLIDFLVDNAKQK